MTQAIVIGVYRFLGFHIANSILSKGNSLIGVEWLDRQVEDVEEKKSFFIRNSNYTFWDNHTVLEEKEPILLVINMYDFIMYREWREVEQRDILNKIKSFVANLSEKNVRVMLFVPEKMDPSIKEEIEQCIEQLIPKAITQWIYLPELYGPWMSSAAPLQQLFSSKDKKFLALNRCIYIDDFIAQWELLMELETETVSIQKERQENWQDDLIRFFQLEETEALSGDVIDVMEVTEHCIEIPTGTNLYEGLQNMEQHRKQLDFMRIFSDQHLD